MLRDPIEISYLNILQEISSNELCVVHARSGLFPQFNTILSHKLKEKFKDNISFCWIDTAKIDLSNNNFKLLLKKWKNYLGLPNSDVFTPGYYLFKNGNIIAYHPGTIDLEKIHPTSLGITSLMAIFAGLIAGVVQKSTLKGFEAFVQFMEAPQAIRMFEFFIHLLEKDFSYSTQQEQQKVIESELQKAYRFFGVNQETTDSEIRKARNEMALKFHPDINQSNQEVNNRIMGEINAAFELIMESRSQESATQ